MLKAKIYSVIILTTLLISNVSIAQDIIKLGVVPQQSASSLAKNWIPLTSYLSEKTGKNVRFTTAPNIPEFEKRVAEGMYDLVYMNPYHYTVFSQSIGMRAIAKQKNKRIHGIIVVQKDSPLTDLDMLKNAEIAFPAPAAFAATILPQANLTLRNIPFKSQYVSSHDSVYAGVAKGLFVAGGGIDRTLSTLPKAQANQLKVIWRSDGYTPHAFAASDGLEPDLINQIQEALISLIDDEKNQSILFNLGFKQGLIKATDSDWDDIRSLNIDLIKP
ncbi:phosphate/phosphite/phosphonate ABC transporter substrate-binding protein [Vibrio sp. TH_r3]|uniref:phosphate/phosphite/phosphonate ABC transporter substrate-binding protein n=1 Tax=Vibrio sp. TH_r3 TaxID=3082084 RepID=UPI002955DD8C|nr:phosphate/phosphite/phosphonate ABC transporter substrate-binding protein [Vibrio sp. TH_r3]MDV7105575.1 phosphate/phosphite/phosphonate ABC transporter substrate-binding protein [Vibrio sp. TH_r3]